MSAAKGNLYGESSREVPQQRKWERAPWWARMFGFTWRKLRVEPNLYDNAVYDYRSKRQLAHEFLEKQFSNEKPFNYKHSGIDSRSWTGM